jgi:hypothetical protein
MANFLELQKMKVMEYKNSASQTEQELKSIQDKFNEHKNAQIELQKLFAESNDRLKAFGQSIFVLEGVIKDLEAPAEVPAEAPAEGSEDPGPQPDPEAEPVAEPVAEVFAEEAVWTEVDTIPDNVKSKK